MSKPFVITIVGAESSGKTTLALQLSDIFQAEFIPELAREYLHSINRPYVLSDLTIIAHEQLIRIRSTIQGRIEQNEQTHQAEPGHGKNLESLARIIEQERKNSTSPIIIIDGGMMTLKMWARIKYNSKIEEVDQALEEDITDLYILSRPQHHWESDPLREAPEIVDRVWIYNQYQLELAKGNIPFLIFLSNN